MTHNRLSDAGTGRTSRAMATAPRGSAYIGPNRAWVRIEGKRLAASVGREDLQLIGMDDLLGSPQRFRGLDFSAAVVDHAVQFDRIEQLGLSLLRPWVGPRPDTKNRRHASPSA